MCLELIATCSTTCAANNKDKHHSSKFLTICKKYPLVLSGLPSHKASDAESISKLWCHLVMFICLMVLIFKLCAPTVLDIVFLIWRCYLVSVVNIVFLIWWCFLVSVVITQTFLSIYCIALSTWSADSVYKVVMIHQIFCCQLCTNISIFIPRNAVSLGPCH